MRVSDDSGSIYTHSREALQGEKNNAHRPPSPPPAELAKSDPKSDPNRELEDSTKSIIPSAPKSRSAAASICNSQVVKHVLMALLTVFVFSTAKPFFEASCKHPAVSQYLPGCIRDNGHSREPFVTPNFMSLIMLQGRLDQVMEGSASGSKVAVDIKDSEMALRDLGILVKHSDLSSKDALGRDLRNFVDHARATSGSLQRFGSRVWGAVDRIVSLNEHTLITLENVPTGKDAITYRKDLEDIWWQSIELLEGTLQQLIHQADENIGSLQVLDERLQTVESMVVLEKKKIQTAERALKKKWFPDQEKLQSQSASLELLEMVKNNRQRAVGYVEDVLSSLKKISYDLDDLRDGVASPMVIASSSNIPIESHIRNIRSGTDRLVNGQTRMREVEEDYRRRKFSSS